MKFNKFTLASSLILGSALIIPTTSLAASNDSAYDPNPDSTKTPVEAIFEIGDTENETPENPGDSDDQNKENNPSGPFGIAYQPAKWTTGTVKLAESGAQDFNFTNTDSRVGVKDKTHDNIPWTLTAKLDWDNELPGSEIHTESKTQIQTNDDDRSSKYENTTNVTGVDNVVINNSPVTVMTASSVDHNAVYDEQLGQVSLHIADASQVKAGTYTGNVTWTLAKTA